MQPPDIVNSIAPINPNYFFQHLSSPLGERRFPLLTSLTPDGDCLAIPLNVASLDVKEFVKPNSAVSKQADDTLIPNVVYSLDEIIHLLVRQAWQYYLGHLWRINSRDWIFLNVVLTIEPIAESSNSSVVSIFAVAAVEIGQEEVNISMRQVIANHKWLETSLIEFKCSRRDTLSSGFEEFRQQIC